MVGGASLGATKGYVSISHQMKSCEMRGEASKEGGRRKPDTRLSGLRVDHRESAASHRLQP